MSSASPLRSESAASTQQWLPAASIERVLRSPFQFVGFWAAIVLPFVFVAMLATGQATQHPTLAGGLLASNLVGLLLGRGYNR
jgi:hypothetical protein